uniref:K-box domain-containing protein n=1 Tax=Fagus sylvatica TaxID=28930 RepID=A0A2N9HFE7_FAGSY
MQKNHSDDVSLPSHAELLEIVQSQLEGPGMEQLTVTDLVLLEKQLNAALTETRSRKTQLMLESIMSLHEKCIISNHALPKSARFEQCLLGIGACCEDL